MQASSALILVPLVLGPLLHYFLRVRPRRRRAEQVAAMQRNLKVDDRVVTSSGLHGTVTALTADTVELTVCPGSNLTHRYDRTSVGAVRLAGEHPAGRPAAVRPTVRPAEGRLQTAPDAEAGS